RPCPSPSPLSLPYYHDARRTTAAISEAITARNLMLPPASEIRRDAPPNVIRRCPIAATSPATHPVRTLFVDGRLDSFYHSRRRSALRAGSPWRPTLYRTRNWASQRRKSSSCAKVRQRWAGAPAEARRAPGPPAELAA